MIDKAEQNPRARNLAVLDEICMKEKDNFIGFMISLRQVLLIVILHTMKMSMKSKTNEFRTISVYALNVYLEFKL